MAKLYNCPHCGTKSPSDEWNIATWKYLKRSTGVIFNIENEKPNKNWVCPYCRHLSRIEQILNISASF